MHHYCYRINYPDGTYYIGMRSSEVEPNLDNYQGSGSAIKGLHGVKSILGTYESRALAFEAETSFIGDLWKEDQLCLNEKPGGKGAPAGEDHHWFGRPSAFQARGEEHPWFGRSHTDESKAKISAGRKGRNCGIVGEGHGMFGKTHTEYARLKLSLKNTGHLSLTGPKSEEHKAKIAAANRGKPKSEEHRKKLSEAKRGKPGRGKPFEIKSPEGVIHSGDNLTHFCLERGLSQPCISHVINGKQSSHKGWTKV